MPRNGSGVYSLPAGSTVGNGDTSDATDINTPLADLVTDANTARPIVAGGTGATSASAARTALAVPGKAASETITGDWTFEGTVDVSSGTLTLPDDVVTLAKIADAALSGSDATLVTGTAGTAGHLARWDTNGDLVTYGQATQTEGAWTTGTSTTESLVSPEKVKAAIVAATTEVSEVATTSGTAVDIITGIPAGINTVELYVRSLTVGTGDHIIVQLGTSGGFVTTNYAGGVAQGASGLSISNGFGLVFSTSSTAVTVNSGTMRLHRVPGTDRWISGSQVYLSTAGGSVNLGADLTQVRVTTDGGSATFSSGGISARYWV